MGDCAAEVDNQMTPDKTTALMRAVEWETAAQIATANGDQHLATKYLRQARQCQEKAHTELLGQHQAKQPPEG